MKFLEDLISFIAGIIVIFFCICAVIFLILGLGWIGLIIGVLILFAAISGEKDGN
jgi:uncharacterized membrane protein HdeD (DUF308 family)